jgi:hypothetical protein
MGTDPKEIELGEEERSLLAEAADRARKPWRQLLREALAKALAEPRDEAQDGACETLYEKMKRTGAIGMVKDAPADLSTNRKYMEGFGGG